MKGFREYLDFWNEFGLVVTGCVCIGYFGSRGWLGFLPGLAAILLILGAIVVSALIAKSQSAPVDDDAFGYEQRGNEPLNKFTLYLGLFIAGIAIFVSLGLFI